MLFKKTYGNDFIILNYRIETQISCAAMIYIYLECDEEPERLIAVGSKSFLVVWGGNVQAIALSSSGYIWA